MEKSKIGVDKYTVTRVFEVRVEVDPDNPKAATFVQIADALTDAPRWMDGVLRIEAYYIGTADTMNGDDRHADSSTE